MKHHFLVILPSSRNPLYSKIKPTCSENNWVTAVIWEVLKPSWEGCTFIFFLLTKLNRDCRFSLILKKTHETRKKVLKMLKKKKKSGSEFPVLGRMGKCIPSISATAYGYGACMGCREQLFEDSGKRVVGGGRRTELTRSLPFPFSLLPAGWPQRRVQQQKHFG